MRQIRTRIQSHGPSDSALQSGVMAVAMIVAGGFDYVVNIVAGQKLPASDFFVFVTVTALLQVMVQATNVIRNVVAYYAAEATVRADSLPLIGSVLRRSWRWSWRWGVTATIIMASLSPYIAQFLHIDSVRPLLAAALALLFLFLRPVTDGILQGVQQFYGLSAVQIVQSILRLLFTALLIGLGQRATGAILALPLGSAVALTLALWLLRPFFRAPAPSGPVQAISWRYSLVTLAGLLAFALMVNIDPIIVRRVFSDAAAEIYAPVATLGKMNLFIPLGIGLVLFPKATQRHTAGRDSRPVLLLALAATLLPGLLLTILYWLYPGPIVRLLFGENYVDPGVLLAMIGLATTLYAGVNIWLNYALSLERRSYIVALAIIVGLQILAMLLIHTRLESIAQIMIVTAVAGNLAGAALTMRGSSPPMASLIEVSGRKSHQ